MSQENDVFSSKSSELKDLRNFKFNITEKTQIPRKSWDSTNQNPNSVDYSKKQKPIFVFNENNLQNNKIQSAHKNQKPRQSIFQPQGKINDQKYILSEIKKIYRKSKINKISYEFCQTLYYSLSQVRKDNLNQNHLNIIDDKSYIWKSDRSFSISAYSKSFQNITKFLDKIKNLQSHSNLFIIWNCLILLLTQFYFFMASVRMIFEIDYHKNPYVYIYSVSVFLFCLDIMLNFISPYYESGILINDTLKIFKRYMKIDFWFDVIPLIQMTTYDVQLVSVESKLVLVLQLLRLKQISRICKKLFNHFNLYEIYPNVMILSNLFYLIFFVAHFGGCIFIYITYYEDNQEQTWLNKQKDVRTNNFHIYLDGLYFVFITMITVGYGDIYPTTPTEKIYVMFITLISCGIFAYAVNVVGSIIQSYQELNANRKRERFLLLKYLEKKQISKNLQIQVLQYLDFVHEINREEDENLGGEVLNKVSENLKNEVLQEYYLRILQNNLTLSQYLSQEMINALAIRMKEKIIGPQELLFKQGEIDDRVIFLVKGKLQIIYTREIYNHLQKCKFRENYQHILFPDEKQFYIYTLENKENIGIESVFISQPKNYTLISQGLSSIVYLTKQDFDDLKNTFPNEHEKLTMMKEDIISKKIHPEKCFLCFNQEKNLHSLQQFQEKLKKYTTQNNNILQQTLNNIQKLNSDNQNQKLQQQINKNRFQKVREHSLANCYQIDYAPIQYLTITKKFNHILEKNSEYNYQKRNIKYIRDQFREKNFFHPYFDFHNINFYLRKYRVENALKIEYQDEEFEKDFYQFVDREFLCSVPQIPQYDEGIRLKYIEANFVSEFIDEENPQESSCQDFEVTDEDFENFEANLVYENIHTEPLESIRLQKNQSKQTQLSRALKNTSEKKIESDIGQSNYNESNLQNKKNFKQYTKLDIESNSQEQLEDIILKNENIDSYHQEKQCQKINHFDKSLLTKRPKKQSIPINEQDASLNQFPNIQGNNLFQISNQSQSQISLNQQGTLYKQMSFNTIHQNAQNNLQLGPSPILKNQNKQKTTFKLNDKSSNNNGCDTSKKKQSNSNNYSNQRSFKNKSRLNQSLNNLSKYKKNTISTRQSQKIKQQIQQQQQQQQQMVSQNQDFKSINYNTDYFNSDIVKQDGSDYQVNKSVRIQNNKSAQKEKLTIQNDFDKLYYFKYYRREFNYTQIIQKFGLIQVKKFKEKQKIHKSKYKSDTQKLFQKNSKLMNQESQILLFQKNLKSPVFSQNFNNNNLGYKTNSFESNDSTQKIKKFITIDQMNAQINSQNILLNNGKIKGQKHLSSSLNSDNSSFVSYMKNDLSISNLNELNATQQKLIGKNNQEEFIERDFENYNIKKNSNYNQIKNQHSKVQMNDTQYEQNLQEQVINYKNNINSNSQNQIINNDLSHIKEQTEMQSSKGGKSMQFSKQKYTHRAKRNSPLSQPKPQPQQKYSIYHSRNNNTKSLENNSNEKVFNNQFNSNGTISQSNNYYNNNNNNNNINLSSLHKITSSNNLEISNINNNSNININNIIKRNSNQVKNQMEISNQSGGSLFQRQLRSSGTGLSPRKRRTSVRKNSFLVLNGGQIKQKKRSAINVLDIIQKQEVKKIDDEEIDDYSLNQIESLGKLQEEKYEKD